MKAHTTRVQSESYKWLDSYYFSVYIHICAGDSANVAAGVV